MVSSGLSSGMRRRRRMDLTPAGIWCRDSKPISSMISISQPPHPPFRPLLPVLWNVMCGTPCSFSSCHPPIYFSSSLLTSPAILFSLLPFLFPFFFSCSSLLFVLPLFLCFTSFPPDLSNSQYIPDDLDITDSLAPLSSHQIRIMMSFNIF